MRNTDVLTETGCGDPGDILEKQDGCEGKNEADNSSRSLREDIAGFARECGADIVGFAEVSRFTAAGNTALTKAGLYGSAPDMIMPGAKTVIGLGFRVLRGAYRGIEECSTFYQFYTMAVETIEEVYIPQVLAKVAGFIEDKGYCAVSQKLVQTVMQDEGDTNPEVRYNAVFRGMKGEAMLNFRQAAVLCGLGEIGLSGSVLTDEFGPNQRFAYIITDAVIGSDEIKEPHLCDKCGKCLEACPGKAFSDESVKVVFGKGKDQDDLSQARTGRTQGTAEYELKLRDNWQCAAYYKGAAMRYNPFMPPGALEGITDRLEVLKGEKKLSPEEAREVMDKLVFYPGGRHSYVASICGKACDRACFIHLEEKGVLTRKYRSSFRKKEPWELEII
ncbi:MAG: hypothetical protein PHG48_02200 [Eubacteriales bacterium]|nr:hypothetical protein [Eubacteriales bacterium]